MSGQLFEKLAKKTKIVNGEKKITQHESVQYLTFLPYSFAFFIEFEIQKCLKRKYIYNGIKGYPLKMEENGKMVVNYKKTADGLYKVFKDKLHERNIDVPAVRYRDVVRGVREFRASRSDYGDYFTLRHIDGILNDMKTMMKVDEYTSIEKRPLSLKEVIPPIAL